MIEFDALAIVGSLIALGVAVVEATRVSGRRRVLVTLAGVASGLALVAADAPIAAGALLVAALAIRRVAPQADATASAWAFFGDALVGSGVGAAALDAGTTDLPWAESAAQVPEWAVAVVAVGALVRLSAMGAIDVPLVVVGAVFGIRLAGLATGPGAPTWLVVAAGIAVALAWAGRPVAAALALGWAALGVGGGADVAPAALLLSGAALVAAAAAADAGRPVDWARVVQNPRSMVPPGAGGRVAVLVVLALIPAGVGLVRIASADAPEAAPVLVGLLVVLVLASQPPSIDAAARLRSARLAAAVACGIVLLVPLVAPGWWADRLGISTAARAVSDALTLVRAGTVTVLVVGGAVGALSWLAASVGKDRPTADA